MAADRQYLEQGDAVGPGPPVYCGEPGRKGKRCRGYVGAPAIGAVLLAVVDLAADEQLTAVERHLWSLRCAGCGRHYVFSVPAEAP